MSNYIRWSVSLILTVVIAIGLTTIVSAEEQEETLQAEAHHKSLVEVTKHELPEVFARFSFVSDLTFEYPDAVRGGIYVTGNSAGGSRFEKLINLINTTDLNAMVIDIKEDNGYVTYQPKEALPYEGVAKNYIKDPKQVLKTLEKEGIYPIARIVVFKDTQLANARPDLSFTQNGEVWKNDKGEAFVSPFKKEVWDYNIDIAKRAAELGFKEIQFDYVRFAEGFEKRDKELEYDLGDYKDEDMNDVKKRVEAVTDFVAYAKKELEYYNVDVSVDIFGYSATIEEAPGIGQNFSRISENVDVISSMIYPSHWTSYFGIDNPDREPYRLTNEYAKVENKVLGALEGPPVSRPWIQDFEAPWLYSGATFQYGVEEVEAQIKALNENGIKEFLLWNSGNSYTEGVDYTPLD
ncbi:glycoside hydrolase [Gracilibacillus boraciitolerans JCM 21714]|uniref:Glycoside hydrolase n=1 Tax=Gracilibacillus boraciitolerans JCM 21714 TaxID=1298598 RepID=W4VLD0_9BACI|nr:putative glycoside hydrolase [Gracilibacillus boraciitolerans]GAE93579.1 glycoside hydrolase [Gracilibacillus boraciitolerans JCM 21714]